MHISPDLPFHTTDEVPGARIDLTLLGDDKWLMNTEVCYWLQERKSQWHLTMLYIAIENPLKFICRKIDTYHSEKKGNYFCQNITTRYPKRC